MAIRVSIFLQLVLVLSLLSSSSLALYEDQVGLTDWHQQYIGKVKSAVFHTQKAGRKRVVVSTEENVVASLDLRTGAIFWRKALGSNLAVNNIDVALGRYVITLLREGSVLRAWNLPDGQMVWESILPVSKPAKTLLLVPTQVRKGTLNLILVSAGSFLHAISGLDGEIIWSKDFTSGSIEIHRTCQSPDGDVIHVLGFSGHSKVVTYQISARNGEVLKEKSATVPVSLSGETIPVSDDMLVALDSTKSILVLVNSQGGGIKVQQKYISELVQKKSGLATILPSKFAGILALKLDLVSVLVQVKADGELIVVETIEQPGLVSDAIVLPGGQQAFAVVHQKNAQVQLKIKVDDMKKDVLVESINMDQQRGLVQLIFVNNYVRTDRSHGFRALLVMEDDSLLLVQQSEIVWNREDGLASIIDSTASELPVEKVGTVAKVEENLMEWLKGHFLKLKGTLMLANAEEMAAIQALRLRNSEKAKMTRDHNGFRKLLVVLTRSGKIYALHTGDGRIVWSCLPSSLRRSEIGQHPNGLNIYPWQVPHHHALDENPSVMVVGRSEGSSKAPGFLIFIDSYTGNELSSLHVHHSIMQVMPLPFINSKEQRLHLIIDSNKYAHLYPRIPDSLDIFTSEIRNIYWYSINAEKNMIQGYSFKGKCLHDVNDEYCFNSMQLWSIVFPPDSEKIIATAKRKNNEVVHTQAKAFGNEDVMYKYISNNVLFVATSAPKGAGDIGSVAPEEAKIVSYLIDTVTGRVLHRLTHHGAQGPIHAVFSENWVVYHYFNLRAHKYEMSVIEIYDQTRADVKDVMKLALGKHNLTSPVSSYSWPEIVAKSQSFFFTHSVKVIAVTSTAKGITSKKILIGTIGDQVLALDKRYLDPRRTLNPSHSEQEEGIMPLTDSLPIIPQTYMTHSLQVEGLKGIVAIPAKLESTTLIFSYGIDLFFTQFAPSKTYDSLTEEFSYALLLITIVALVAAIFITWIMSQQKELKERWR